MKTLLLAAALCLATGSAAVAQSPGGPGTACPAGTRYATIRHSLIKDGQWATFEAAVAAHEAWYKSHGDATHTTLIRVIAPPPPAFHLSATEAVTLTVYSDKPQPAHDESFAAFTAKYRESSTIKDEARVCLPDMR